MTNPAPSRWRRVAGPLLPGIAQTAALALVCNAALELTQVTESGGYPWKQKTPTYALMFVLGSLVVWLVIGLVHAVVGRLSVTVTVSVLATAVVAVADYEKVRLRREPIYPTDWEFLRDAGFLTQMIGLRVILLLVVGIVLVAVAAAAGLRAERRRHAVRPAQQRSAYPPASPATRATLRVLTGVLCVAGLAYLGQFNAPGNAARRVYDSLGATWRPWSQERNYLGNGFVGGFLYNLGAPAIARPAGYGAAEMDRIIATYAAAARRINRHRTAGALDDVNVVMVLSESFSDPGALHGVHPATDPIPFTRRLMRSTMSGRMLAQNIGGGTANMEFENLTGMSLSQLPPQLRVPYQMMVPKYHAFPSAVRWFEEHGHRTVAIHPFTTEMYRRRDVYRTFGFDDFVYDRRMHDQRRIGHDAYISDAAAFHEVQRTIEAERRPVFVNLVTMQNHVPYKGKYDDPLPVTDAHGNRITGIEDYARGLAYTDRALADWVVRLRHSREKTLVVFYGDHLPGTYPDQVFAANTDLAMHQTPFFVWDNFGGPATREPTTSPIHFMDLALQRAHAAVPPYYALLEELRREVPGMDGGVMVDAAGRRVRRDRLSPRAVRLLHDYRMVQYDLSVGRRYTERAMFGGAGAPGAVTASATGTAPDGP